MTNKYIIKKCPAFLGEQIQCASYPVLCKDKQNCSLKQIAERCKSSINLCDKCEGDEIIDCIDCTQGGKAIMGNYILDLLEIQECEE